MRVLRVVAVAASAVALVASLVAGECLTFYVGLCPGPDNCECTMGEACGAELNWTLARSALGGCNGKCRTVTHDRCGGPAECLLAGAECGSGPGPAPGPGPNRATIIDRAKNWCARKIPYCQCNGPAECCGTCPYCNPYRCDCSGYVSWCLELPYGYTTDTLPEVSHRISKDELLPGDFMDCVSDHVVLFGGWTDASKTHYVAYQEPGCHTVGPHYAFSSVVPYPFDWNPGCFEPYRKNGLTNDGTSPFATDEQVKAALVNGLSYPPKHERDVLRTLPARQNHTRSLMMRLFGKLI